MTEVDAVLSGIWFYGVVLFSLLVGGGLAFIISETAHKPRHYKQKSRRRRS